ncbi:MAG TPA: YihY/virulence factor BrkB family protein [Chitinophagaceae bacterium]|nr:YihY/virulence factor BrkB family protein [Chitinophagaceae bacterium]
MSVKRIWKVIKRSFADFFANNVLKLSAALAFSTIFSLPGLLIIIIWFSNIFYRREVVEGSLYGQMAKFIGQDAAASIQETMRNSLVAGNSHFATIVGFVALLIGATSVFGEIQDSINLLWKLKAKPKKGTGWLRLIINRLLSFSMIVSLGFILLVSLVVNGTMDILINHLLKNFPNATVIVVYIVNVVVTFLITAFIFGLIFKVLPDARIKWRHVRAGAFTTAIFFMVGKFLISYYLGHSTMTTAYGTAGSVIVVLLWVYYSSAILYFGASFTREYAIESGSQIYPNNYAVWVEQVEVVSKQPLSAETQTNH